MSSKPLIKVDLSMDSTLNMNKNQELNSHSICYILKEHPKTLLNITEFQSHLMTVANITLPIQCASLCIKSNLCWQHKSKQKDNHRKAFFKMIYKQQELY